MNNRYSRVLLWLTIFLVIVVIIGFSFRPATVLTDIDTLSRNSLLISISEEGKTRIHDTYIVSSPVTGYLRRINADVGDAVSLSSTVIASIEPIDPTFLDPRTEAQAKADIEAAASSKELAKAQVALVEAELDFALAEFNRMRELIINGSVSQRELDAAERAYRTTRAELATTQAALQMKIFELERAQAQLLSPVATQTRLSDCQCIDITAPIDGKVLKILNKSEGVVQAGTPLVEIGDPRRIEIVVELLSFDAVKVEVGQDVLISNWGGEDILHGKVSQIEPVGFKKVSALGIEEQRVNVIVAFAGEYQERARLGHGYQVDVEVVLLDSADVLTLPISALFRERDDWAVYAVVNGTIEKRIVKIGRRNSFATEVLSGLSAGEAFVVHPNEQTKDGTRVAQRN